MTWKIPRPIVPAPPRAPGYPRATTVWRAFAAGVLTVAAFPTTSGADCALPEHGGADKTAQPVGKKNPAQIKSATDAPHPPMPGRMTAVKPVALGGVEAPTPHVLEGKIRAPEPAPPRDNKKPAPTKTPKKKPKPELEGEQASVTEAVIHLHPHGPDEPCHVHDPALGRLVIRFG